MSIQYFKTKIFLIAGTLICLSVLIISLFLTLGKQGSVLPDVLSLMHADIQIRDFSFIQSRNGYNEWEIKASHAEIFEDQDAAVLKELEVQFMQPEGRGMTFRGKQGKLDTQNHDFEISSGDHGIEIIFDNGYRIATRSLKWTNQDQRILTSDPVEIKGPGLKIKGQGMEAHLASQEFRVLSDVRAEIF